MNDRHVELIGHLAGELAGVVRGSLSRSPEERAASVARWEALRERAGQDGGDRFREDLNGILSEAVARLEALHDEVLDR
jgi:hypothetical protein